MVIPQKILQVVSLGLLVSGSILLLFAQSAYWINNTIFNQAQFINITTAALNTQSSRDAIATAIVDASLENNPVIKQVAGSRIASFVSGLLASDLSTQAIQMVGNKTYAYITAENRKDIVIDLTLMKSSLAVLVSLAQRDNDASQRDVSQAQIPDKILLVRSADFPNLSGLVRAMLWLTPLFWIGSILLFVAYVYMGKYIHKSMFDKRVYAVGVSIIVVAIVGLMAGPFLPPPLVATIPIIELRPVVDNLARGFLAPFMMQMTIMLVLTLVALAVFHRRRVLLDGLKLLDTKIRSKDATKNP